MGLMMFLNQVHHAILCGSDVTVRVMIAFGLYGKEGWVFFSLSQLTVALSTPICVLIIFVEGNEGSLFVKKGPMLT